MKMVYMIFRIEGKDDKRYIVNIDTLTFMKSPFRAMLCKMGIINLEDADIHRDYYINRKYTILKKLKHENGLLTYIVIDIDGDIHLLNEQELNKIRDNITNIKIIHNIPEKTYGQYELKEVIGDSGKEKMMVLNGVLDETLRIEEPIFETNAIRIVPYYFTKQVRTLRYGPRIDTCLNEEKDDLYFPYLENLSLVVFESNRLRNATLPLDNNNSIRRIIIHGLVSIEESGFSNLKQLEDFEVIDTTYWDGNIPRGAFFDCKNLDAKDILELKGLKCVENSSLKNCRCSSDTINIGDTLLKYAGQIIHTDSGNKLDINIHSKNLIIVNRNSVSNINLHIKESIDCYNESEYIFNDIPDLEYDNIKHSKLLLFDNKFPKVINEEKYLDWVLKSITDKELYDLLDRLNLGSNFVDYEETEVPYIVPFNNNLFSFNVLVFIRGLIKKVFRTGDEKFLGVKGELSYYRYLNKEYALPYSRNKLIEFIEYNRLRNLFSGYLKYGMVEIVIESYTV